MRIEFAGAHGLGPAEVGVHADEAARKRRGTFDEQPHGQRSRLPPAGDKPAEKARLGGLRIDVKILRIIVAREADDLLGRQHTRLGAKSLAYREILEIERHAFPLS